MKKRTITFLLLFICTLGFTQSEIGLHVTGSQSVLFGDTIRNEGKKLIWYRDIAAFRAGSIENSAWDYENIGYGSFAAGLNTRAVRAGTTALGFDTGAKGDYSTAIGAIAMANGPASMVMGDGTLAQSIYSNCFGRYNWGYGNPQTSSPYDPIMELGIGVSSTLRQNALTIFKNGQHWLHKGLDASLTTHGFLMLGNPAGKNVIIDDNEIMSRDNGQPGFFHINNDGGDIIIGAGTSMPHLSAGSGASLKMNFPSKILYWESSSRRYKTEIQPIRDNCTLILQCRPVKYTRPTAPNQWEIGYIAEEMASIGLINLVGYNEQGIAEYVHYDKIVLYATEIMKSQETKISKNQEIIKHQEQQLNDLIDASNKYAKNASRRTRTGKK